MSAPSHFRYREFLCEQGVMICRDDFYTLKETPKGYFVAMYANDLREDITAHWLKNKRQYVVRFVLKDSVRRHCYPTQAEAMESFAIRKRFQLKKIEDQAIRVRQALAKAEKLLAVGGHDEREINAGMPVEYSGLAWS